MNVISSLSKPEDRATRNYREESLHYLVNTEKNYRESTQLWLIVVKVRSQIRSKSDPGKQKEGSRSQVSQAGEVTCKCGENKDQD